MSKQVPPMQTEIYSTIQNRIRSGEYTPGEKLSENLLATEFNCSRMPVREALKHLEQDGLVTIQPKSGTYVRSYSPEEVRNAVEIRAYLEALAFTLLIEKNVDTTPMERCIVDMARCMENQSFDLAAFGEHHMQFHEAMVCLADNPFLVELYNKLHLNALQKIFFNPMSKEEMTITHAEHQKILQFIKDKNPEGEQFIKMHLWKRREH
ncbi:MAG: GntR family transcriptional regulator [Spirochaetaceae bacterium]|nr:GntR family transcriptional regulator [Spirochaetaceae bacterium]